MRLLPLMIAASLSAALAAPAIAQTPIEAMKLRHDKFESFGAAMKKISDSLRSGKPDAAMIGERAAYLAGEGPSITSWFPKGSGPESGRKTEALPAIWMQPAEFASRADAFTKAAKGLQAAAATGDAAAMGQATQTLGGTCKGCHDNFRLKKK